jgi:hypothetical protein
MEYVQSGARELIQVKPGNGVHIAGAAFAPAPAAGQPIRALPDRLPIRCDRKPVQIPYLVRISTETDGHFS